jgi:hypothetical protein
LNVTPDRDIYEFGDIPRLTYATKGKRLKLNSGIQ